MASTVWTAAVPARREGFVGSEVSPEGIGGPGQTPNEGRPDWARPFCLLWISQAVSSLGSQLVSFVLIWHLARTTGSASVLANAALCTLLPQVFLSPFAGVLIDRVNRKWILIAVQGLTILAMGSLAFLFSSGNVELSPIYLLISLFALGSALNNPAMIATTSLMVPNRHLTRVQGMNQTLQGGLSICFAPLGALLLEMFPMHGIFAVSVLAPLVACICLFPIGIPQPTSQGQKVRTVVQEMQAGLHYVCACPGLVLITAIAVFLNFLDSPAAALTPLLVTKHFKGDALQLGWMNSTLGGGIVLGGLVLSVWGGFRRRITTSMSGIIGMGLGAMLVGVTPASAFWLAVVGILIKGFMQSLGNGPIIAALQSSIDPAMQGRVIALIISLASAAAPVGLLVAGALGERWGAPIWFILLGGSCIVLGGAGLLIPSIRTFGAEIPERPQMVEPRKV